MQQGNWSDISKKIIEEDKTIFKGINKEGLSNYEKRKIIFNYLTNNIEYDYQRIVDIFLFSLVLQSDNLNTLDIRNIIREFLIKNNITDESIVNLINERISDNNYRTGRNPYLELEDTIYNHKGICNSISQYYKLLLEYNGIYSVCVICDNMLPKNHEINLVYDDEYDIYSFDDVTSAIINKNIMDKCFDYDIEQAKEINQGLRTVGYLNGNDPIFDTFGVILSTDTINYYVGRENSSHLKYGLETNNNIQLPDNIKSRKKLRGELNENINRYKKSR